MASNGCEAAHAVSAARDPPEEEEMLAEERDLAEDAQWKRIQQNTFTRWANEHLKNASKHIYSLETDLQDGLMLIALIEVLSGKKMPKHSKRPTFRSQKLENVSVALKFLERDENIKIVNIDSTHIVDCQLKLILGLIWTLILHYSISMPMWEGDENVPGEKGPTPKQRLMNWIGSKMPDLPVRNFTSDWRDGKAIGALVDGVAPGLCPDWSDWKPEDALKNATEAMGLADDWLNVPQLIQPEDMIDPNVDELSMMTYLSQYPNAKLKAGAPLRAKTNPNRVRCYGPGVEPTGPVVGAPTFFTVETFSAGQGKVECFLIRPNGQKEPIEAKFNNDRNLTYSCSYMPTSEGQHRVIVKFIGNEIPKSPFTVNVEGYAGDPNKVTASGPGLEPVGVVVSKPTYFDIFTQDAGKGTPEVVILDPKGKQNPAMLKLREVKQGQWRCEYVAEQVGMYSINIYFATKPIPKSPFGVKVSPACDPRRVKATGRGLQNKGVRVGETADFKLWTEGAGEGVPKVRIIGPGGADEPAELRKVSDFVYEGAYFPKREGRYIVMITYSGTEIPRSPFEVNVGPKTESAIRCYGPGLKGGVVGSPATFTVETNGETGALGFSVEGPSQAQIQCHDNGDGSADVSYLPTAPGEYAVHVLCEGEDIPQSPWMAQVIPKTDYDASKVRVFGPGVQKDGVSVNKPTHFTVDTTAAGNAPLDVTLIDEDLRSVPIKITEKSPGVYHVEYTITTSGKHTIMVNFGGVAVPNSPFRVHVTAPVDETKVQVFGPGLEPGVRAQVPTHFNVDARGAGPAELRIGLKENKTGKEVPVQLTDNGDGTMTADYVYPRPGPYTLNVTYGGRAIPQSPLNVEAKPVVDTSKIRVDGIEPTAFLNSPTDMLVDARAVPGAKDGRVTCPVTGPSGAPCPSHVEPVGDGTFKATYTPTEPGPHKIDLAYDGAPVPGAPFTVTAKPGCDPRKVTADGPGLKRGIVNKPNTFKVNTRGAGTGGLGLAVEGPSEAKMSCVDNKDGSCTVEYVPTEPGEYDINVRYADQHIPGSPFKVPVDCEVDADNVVAYGPGVEPEHCRANVPLTFTVDATRSAPAPLAVEVKSDKGPLPKKPVVKDNGDGTYDVTYHPPPEGSICMPRVTLAGRDIKDSPWRMTVKPTCEPNKVRLTGPGVSSKGVPASLPTEFTVDARDAGFGDLEAQILGPDGYPRKVEMVDNGDGTYTGRYTPDDCGQYKVHVKYGGKEVAGSPVPVQAFATGHADKCRIEEGDYRDQVLSVDEQYCISVDAKQAGNGNVTCRIRSTSGSGDVDIDVTDNGDGTFNIYYKVKDAGEYSLNIKFGGQPVPDGLYSFSAQSEDNVTRTRTEHLKSSATSSSTVHTREEYYEYEPVELNNIPLPTTGGHVTAVVNMPSGSVDKPLIEDNRDGTVSVKYEPKEEGLHELVVKYNGENVQDTSSEPPESSPAILPAPASENSAGSLASAGFVPTAEPPPGWLRTTTAAPGRWRQQQDDPYQAQSPIQTAQDVDGGLSSDIPAVDKQLCDNVDKLKKSAMVVDTKSKERGKPEWVRIAEEGLLARERVLKGQSFVRSRNRKAEEDQASIGSGELKSRVTQKEGGGAESNKVRKEENKADVASKTKVVRVVEHEKEECSESAPTLLGLLKEKLWFRADKESHSDNSRCSYPSPDPFTFGKQPKHTKATCRGALDHTVCSHNMVESGVSRKRVFIKERFLSSSDHDHNSRGSSGSLKNGHCICKDFVRRKPDPMDRRSVTDDSPRSKSAANDSSHSLPKDSTPQNKKDVKDSSPARGCKKLATKDKTVDCPSKDASRKSEAEKKDVSPTKAESASEASRTGKTGTPGVWKDVKTSSKDVVSSSDAKQCPKEASNVNVSDGNARTVQINMSVSFSEQNLARTVKLENSNAKLDKLETSMSSSKEKKSIPSDKGVDQDSKPSTITSPPLDSRPTTTKRNEIASQTLKHDTKTLETQTSPAPDEAAKGSECASQTSVTSLSVATRAGGSQTDATSRAEPRSHSITLVVPARKSSLRSVATDGAGGDPCAPCQSTLSGGFVVGGDSHSTGRHITTVSSMTTPCRTAQGDARRREVATHSLASVCPAGSVTCEPRHAAPNRRRRRADLVTSSDDSFVSAAAPRRLASDQLSLASRCSTPVESRGFLSASSSAESLHSALAGPGEASRPLRPPLGIPMSGGRSGGGAVAVDRAAERQKKRCSKALEQLGMATRLKTPAACKNVDLDVVSVAGFDAAGGGRPVADGGVFRSATSVSEVAPCSGGDAKQGATWGKWRRTAGAERAGRHRRSGESTSEPESDLSTSSRSKHSVQITSSSGSPFKFHVDSISSGYVTAHGAGLVHGITGEPANFTISTKDAGAGGLSLAVEGPSKAEISCHDNKDGTVSVSYLPTSPGEYKVAVKFADKHIKGSPYSVKVTGEGRKRNQVSLGSQSEVTLPGKVTEKDIKALNASITAPSGLEEPCFLKKLPNDHLGISFTPREIGQHLVMVKKKGVEIAGSPFKIMVSPKEVGDASKVKVSGTALKEGKTHQDNKVLIDTKEAGYGGLSMSIEGPSKAEIKCDDKDDGKLEVSYNPKEPGFYIINLKFADHHVQGSPFTAKVTGEGSNTQTERIKRDRDAAPITTVGSSCALTFKMPGVSALDLSATVASPGGVVEDANITELEDNLHAVNFVPKELGVHTVSVRYRDVHIPGSPFQFTVGPLKDGGAHRVHAGGPGLERGEQNMPNEFNVWTREAGAGSLAISVEGPSKAEIDFKDRKDGSCYVSYIVSEPGEYRVGVKFNDSHIPESPYKVYVTPANKDAHRVSVNQLPDAGVQVDKPIVFTVDRSGCKGQLDCKVVSPSGHEDDCFAQYLDEDTYSVRFLPKENGIHQLHVKWNNVHVPGSPFRLKIGKQDADPAAVHAHGKGLEKAYTGQKTDFIVDTCNAGSGTLLVTVDGPSKVAMDCTEVEEGYKVRYTPLIPGHYYVGIKYDGYHIAGSPFKVDVEGDELAERGPREQSAVVVETIEKVTVNKQENKGPSMPKFNSDAAKVTSKGMGLKKAFVGRQNQFTVDAGKAGQDMLWVGCFGPKNPCEEVHIKHTGRNQYQVFYTVKERGKYILVVRWGEKDIPGSPFEVEV